MIDTYLKYLQEAVRDTRASKEIETILKCGSLPIEFKNFIELVGMFKYGELYGHKRGGHKIFRLGAEDVIKQTLSERDYFPLIPKNFIAIGRLGNGDIYFLECKSGKVYIALHEIVDEPLNEQLELEANSYKDFLKDRAKNAYNSNAKKELLQVIKII